MRYPVERSNVGLVVIRHGHQAQVHTHEPERKLEFRDQLRFLAEAVHELHKDILRNARVVGRIRLQPEVEAHFRLASSVASSAPPKTFIWG